MIPRKGFDVLLRAMTQLPSNIGCYIVGGQPAPEYTEMVSNHDMGNVHFVDFLQKCDLENYYKAADIFVLPTREDIWGLVVNEAMAKGLPVVTTNRCIAGLELIKSSLLGEIVPVNDDVLLAKAIMSVIDRCGTHASHAVLEVIQAYTLEKMAQKHMEILP